jgi:hypothetical protein
VNQNGQLGAFAEAIRQQVILDADAEGAEAMLPQVFTRYVIDALVEAGELEEAVECYHRDSGRGIEVTGWGIEDEDTLNLVATVYRGEVPPPRVPRRDIATAFERLRRLWDRCQETPYHQQLEESSDAWDMALAIHETAGRIERLRLFVVTDGVSDMEYIEPTDAGNVEIRRAVWDLQRLHRFQASGERGEPITIDFIERFGRPLPCLPAGMPTDGLSAYLAVFPGEVLARIYDDFGPRLLELNVRSFLQATGKVNRGIRDTLAAEPQLFLAYNNGISATASTVEVVPHDGGLGISKLEDLQIVNGGQTTASVHRALRTGIDITPVAVQAKITEVSAEQRDEIVPRISRYANSQNKVSEADLRSNDPFHVEVESLSRNVWAPATEGTMRQTRWFYERARGQYADALNRERTPARRRVFREINPTRQRFTKTDLAKYENSWAQLPHEVSRGAQKNFTSFMLLLSQRGVKPDVAYFQRLVAKAILFKRAERIVSAQNFGGYRANIVTYSIAKLSHATQQRLDLQRIWNEQSTDPAVDQALEELAHISYRVLTAADRSATNVTEWAKRDACWNRLKAESYVVPPPLQTVLVQLGPGVANREDVIDSAADHPLIAEMSAVPADRWFAVANWAKQTGNLRPYQRGMAYSFGKYANQGRLLSVKQATQGRLILDEAAALGFLPDQ